MDRFERSANLIKKINEDKRTGATSPELLKEVCAFFNDVKNGPHTEADLHFLRYIAMTAGVPQYYAMLGNFIEGFGECVRKQSIFAVLRMT